MASLRDRGRVKEADVIQCGLVLQDLTRMGPALGHCSALRDDPSQCASGDDLIKTRSTAQRCNLQWCTNAGVRAWVGSSEWDESMSNGTRCLNNECHTPPSHVQTTQAGGSRQPNLPSGLGCRCSMVWAPRSAGHGLKLGLLGVLTLYVLVLAPARPRALQGLVTVQTQIAVVVVVAGRGEPSVQRSLKLVDPASACHCHAVMPVDGERAPYG